MKNLLLVLMLAASFPVYAGIMIDTSVGEYEVTFEAGSFDTFSEILQSQVWWQDAVLAGEFAELVGRELGTFFGGFGPFFAYDLAQIGEDPVSFVAWCNQGEQCAGENGDQPYLMTSRAQPEGEFVYAVARMARVDEPGILGLLGMGLLALMFTKRGPHRSSRT